MRGAWLLAVATLAACEEKLALFTAECHDGSRIAGAKEVVESRCSRHRGIRSLTPLSDAAQNGPGPAPQNGD